MIYAQGVLPGWGTRTHRTVHPTHHFSQPPPVGKLLLLESCFPSPKLTSVAFKSVELKKYLIELDTFGGTNPDGFSLFSLRR